MAKAEVSLVSSDALIIVAYHLPLKVHREEDGGFNIQWDDERGLNRDGIGGELPMSPLFVGCIDLEVPDLAEQESLERILLDQFGCVVIFLEPELKASYYHGFCRRYLTPCVGTFLHQDSHPQHPEPRCGGPATVLPAADCLSLLRSVVPGVQDTAQSDARDAGRGSFPAG